MRYWNSRKGAFGGDDYDDDDVGGIVVSLGVAPLERAPKSRCCWHRCCCGVVGCFCSFPK